MKEQNDYAGVTEEDFKAMDAIFKGLLEDAVPLTAGHPELEDLFADFITKVGIQSKGILQKYHNDNCVKALEVEDYKNQMFEMKQKLVRIEMMVLPVSKACNKLMNNLESTKKKK